MDSLMIIFLVLCGTVLFASGFAIAMVIGTRDAKEILHVFGIHDWEEKDIQRHYILCKCSLCTKYKLRKS